jgi:uncharacterized protein (DUF1919 family)
MDKMKIKNKDFTIISNNCWGGNVYQSLDMQYHSPTVGMYFYADEYIKFLKNFEYYMQQDLKFIPINESKYCNDIISVNNSNNYPIGILGDVEIVFFHYKNEQEALDKWNRRVKRINWNKILFKFNDQNLCMDHHLQKFDELPYEHKICFTAKKHDNIKSCVQFEEYKDSEYVINDTKESIYKKYVDVYKLLNNLK